MRGFVAIIATVLLAVGLGLGALAAWGNVGTSAKPGFSAAKDQWEAQPMVSGGALQNVPFFLAEHDLVVGLTASNGLGATGYREAIVDLELIQRTPDADVTPGEERTFETETSRLDAFFGVLPSALSCGIADSGPVRTAAQAWRTEPETTANGLKIAPLLIAVSELEQAAAKDPSNAACYAATVDGLEGLATASPSEVIHSPPYTGLVTGEVAFVSYALGSFRLQSLGQAP